MLRDFVVICFCESNYIDIFALSKTDFKNSVNSNSFSVRRYLYLMHKDSTHELAICASTHELAIYVK